MIFTAANLITLGRIILTPLFLYFLFGAQVSCKVLALAVFLIASITDAYDGYIARKYAAVSNLGKFLDPLADKILMSAAFIAFAVMDLIPGYMIVIILLRDFLVTGLRMFFSYRGQVMETRRSAKIKTGIQIVGVCFVLIYLILIQVKEYAFFMQLGHMLTQNNIVYIFMLIVTIFTAATGLEYIFVNWKSIRSLGNHA